MLIAGYTIGASQGSIYIRAEYPLAIERLRRALADMRELGLLGERILGSDFSFDIKIKEGAGAFVCGEETALIAGIEGRRGMPRTRPPFPAEEGLWGKPTIINNVETLATLPHIIRNGAEWYSQFGTETSKGTKTFSLVGKVRRTGLIEVPLGMTLRSVIYDMGGGLVKEFKAVQTGGPSGGCLGEEFLDLPIDYESLAAAGSIMGSGGLIVIDRNTCIVDTAKYFLNFTQAESCGKCVPCRVGTRHLVHILERISQGTGRARRPGQAGAPGPLHQGRFAVRAGPDRAQPGAHRAQVFPRRVPGPHQGQALPGRGLPRPGRLPDHQEQVHRLPALRAGLPHGGHQRAPFRAAQPGRIQVHQVPLLLRDLPLRRHRRRRHRHRIESLAIEDKLSPKPVRAKEAKTIIIEIDHRPVSCPEGVSVLRAAELSGIYIPSLCSHKDLSAFGGCRLCMVEIEGMRGYPLACSTIVAEGMKVLTETAALREMRREILQLILSEHPSSCLICDEQEECRQSMVTIRKAGVTTGCRYCPNDGQCELQAVVERLGVTRHPLPGLLPRL